jgi:imidazolonepropionase-like amidohydrolase
MTCPAGTTLLPGLIDAHTRLLQPFDLNAGSDGPNQPLQAATLSSALRVLDGAKNAHEFSSGSL